MFIQVVEREMALIGKKVAQFEIKSKCDVFHELWKTDPHQIPNVSPTTYQNCQTLEGEVGTVGSVLLWHYFHGKLYTYMPLSYFFMMDFFTPCLMCT